MKDGGGVEGLINATRFQLSLTSASCSIPRCTIGSALQTERLSLGGLGILFPAWPQGLRPSPPEPGGGQLGNIVTGPGPWVQHTSMPKMFDSEHFGAFWEPRPRETPAHRSLSVLCVLGRHETATNQDNTRRPTPGSQAAASNHPPSPDPRLPTPTTRPWPTTPRGSRLRRWMKAAVKTEAVGRGQRGRVACRRWW